MKIINPGDRAAFSTKVNGRGREADSIIRRVTMMATKIIPSRIILLTIERILFVLNVVKPAISRETVMTIKSMMTIDGAGIVVMMNLIMMSHPVFVGFSW